MTTISMSMKKKMKDDVVTTFLPHLLLSSSAGEKMKQTERSNNISHHQFTKMETKSKCFSPVLAIMFADLCIYRFSSSSLMLRMCSYMIKSSMYLVIYLLIIEAALGFSTIGYGLRAQKQGSKFRNNHRIISSELQVKWFGGSLDRAKGEELLGVKIERTSPNSRRIAGEIIVSTPMDDVWAILTDYDNLAVHVPNLVESRRVGPSISNNVQGDGNYECKLFQKGAQKIIGFEFGASVTMQMTENIMMSNVVTPRVMKLGREKKVQAGEQRRIKFKCVESQFFSEFDGEWKCTWIDDPNDAFELATKVEYVVDVRPRGPVPVQALEWRIREDVPTNLRAVKMASIKSGLAGVMKMRRESLSQLQSANTFNTNNEDSFSRRGNNRTANGMERDVVQTTDFGDNWSAYSSGAKNSQSRSAMPVHVKWYDDETMATYLDGNN